MSSFARIFFALLIGIPAGALLSWFSIQSNHGFRALKVGQWTAWPLVGSVDADPYTRAKAAVDGTMPLGAAEGLAFHTAIDETGQVLRRECRYLVSGNTPPARMWTLSAYDKDGNSLNGEGVEAPSAFSQQMLRTNDGSFDLNVGATASSGNWLPISGKGRFVLVMRLYDTPLTANTGLVEPVMPRVVLRGCA